MTINFEKNFVAFIDVLGFSEMVKKDALRSDAPEHLEKLYKAHAKAKSLFSQDINISLTQFSDSVVIARKFDTDLETFLSFIKQIAEYQKNLFLDGILCRGGVALGKHFKKDDFLYSQGLIEAYYIESKRAIHPRILISENLIGILYEAEPTTIPHTVKEDDGSVFIDYLSLTSREPAVSITTKINAAIKSDTPSVKEKILWLSRYVDHKFGSDLSPPKFMSHS